MDPNSAFAKHLKTNPWNLRYPLLDHNNSKQKYVPFRLVPALRTLNTKNPPKLRSVSKTPNISTSETLTESDDDDEEYKDDHEIKKQFYDKLKKHSKTGLIQGGKHDFKTSNEFLKSRTFTKLDPKNVRKDPLRETANEKVDAQFKKTSDKIDGLVLDVKSNTTLWDEKNPYVKNKIIPQIVRLFNKLNKKNHKTIRNSRDYMLLYELLNIS